MQESSKIKKSIILSGLVGTGGMFMAKLIGIVYAIPFSSILGSDVYMGIYGQAYNIYSYVLSVFTAGFPFAIATLVARYTVLKDAHTVLLIRKIAFVALALMGFNGSPKQRYYGTLFTNLITGHLLCACFIRFTWLLSGT